MTDVFCPPCVCARGAALRHFLHLNCLHLCEEQALSTTGWNDAGVSPWLDEFFGNCSQLSGCDPTKLEGIAFHDYNGNVARLLQRASGLSSRYGPTIGQPAGARIWITVSGTASQQTLSPFSEPCTKACCLAQEFAVNHWACGCTVTRAMLDAYLAEALPALDNHPAIERYAWYTARDDPSQPGGIHTPAGGTRGRY
jgi:hypothetical protein